MPGGAQVTQRLSVALWKASEYAGEKMKNDA
jgi:hypothetical protein